MPRVLVTRPQPGADQTAARLRERGFAPVVLPLSKTVPLQFAAPTQIPELIVATSPQAFHHLRLSTPEAFLARQVHVTGAATAAAARAQGFANVAAAEGDVDSLISAISPLLKPGIKVLYFAGRVRRPDLEQHLRDSGARLEAIETYNTFSVSYSAEKIDLLSHDGSVAAILLTSATCAAGLQALAVLQSGRYLIENAHIICLSQRVSAAVPAGLSNRVHVAPKPKEEALLECLEAAIGHH